MHKSGRFDRLWASLETIRGCYTAGEPLAELQAPLPDRLVGHRDAASRQHLLDHVQAQREANRATSDLVEDRICWRPMARLPGPVPCIGVAAWMDWQQYRNSGLVTYPPSGARKKGHSDSNGRRTCHT